MNLQAFADHGSNSTYDNLFNRYSRVCFTAKEYPLLFFTLLWQRLKKNNTGISIRYTDIHNQNYAQFVAQCSVSFLGQRCLYWLANISADTQLDKKIEHYIAHYEGPNTLLFFSSEQLFEKHETSALIVDLPDQVSLADALLISRIMQYDAISHTRFIEEIFKKTKTISLETCCLLLEYASLLSGDSKTFFDEYFHILVAPQQSLFTLSQYFFAKQEKHFFAYWNQIKETYSLPFWCSFWSEQLWRAYHYSYYMKNNNSAGARAVSFRLPFSFLKKDWQTITRGQLQRAHGDIYVLDHAIKNGGNLGMFDLFYVAFFSNH